MKKMIAACFAVVAISSTVSAFADEGASDWRMTLSMKGWIENWAGWSTTGALGGTLGNGTVMNNSDATTAIIYGATIRYKDIFVSGNSAAEQSFYFTDTGSTATRSESDLNFGWYLNPNIALTIGQKTVTMTYGGSSVWKHSVNTIGLNASARVGEGGMFMYENGAISLDGATDHPASASYTKGTPVYKSIEAGLGYAASSNLIFTAGYKVQDIQLPITFASTGLTENTRDTTSGFIFGMAVTF